MTWEQEMPDVPTPKVIWLTRGQVLESTGFDPAPTAGREGAPKSKMALVINGEVHMIRVWDKYSIEYWAEEKRSKQKQKSLTIKQTIDKLTRAALDGDAEALAALHKR